jgi:histidine triad (HIT) family protein
MVILKKHGNNILEYHHDELGKAMETVQIVAKKIETALQCDSITIGINHKERRGVPHLHIHLIPRWENDEGHALQGVVKNPPQESVSEIAEKLRKS